MKEKNRIEPLEVFKKCFGEWTKTTAEISSDVVLLDSLDNKRLWEKICLVDDVLFERVEKRAISFIEAAEKELSRQEEIEELEEKNVGEVPWELKGEIKAQERPKDSLLDRDVEFDRKTTQHQMAPEEESKDSIDALLRQRIIEKNFDDVVVEKTRKKEVEATIEEIERKPFLEVYQEEAKQTKKRKEESISKEREEQHLQIKRLFKRICQGIDSFGRIDF